MSSNRARTRAIRERMAETGEPFTLAARRHDAERAAKATHVQSDPADDIENHQVGGGQHG